MPLDLTKPVQTRDGRKARIIASDVKGDYPIVAVIEMSDGSAIVMTHAADGATLTSAAIAGQPSDLINVPKKIKVDCWTNVYPDGTIGRGYAMRDAASRNAPPGTVAQIHINQEVEIP